MGLLDDAYTKAKHIAGLLSDYYQTGAQIYFPNKADASARKKAAGLLSDRAGDAYDYLGKRASVIAADPLGELARSVDNMMGGEYNRQLNQRATLGLDAVAGSDQTNASLQSELNRKLLDVALNGITVWHGSPHKFDKFDMSKIGTGEGAQAYGHGLYFAESPDVANSYVQSVVANSDELAKRGASHGLPADVASNLIAAKQSGKNFDAMIDAAKKAADNPLLPQSQKLAARRLVDHEMQAYNAWSDWSKPGSLYKVDLPDEAVARMLDWDKPLSQQAPEVQGAVKEFFARNPETGGMWSGAEVSPRNMTGQQLYQKLSNGSINGKSYVSGEDISQAMRDSGLTGIRYLDGGSRAGGQGTSNYVLFSDQLPRILEVNGKPTGQIPWSPGEWKGLLGQ